MSKTGVLVQYKAFLYITSRYNQWEAHQTLTHICLFVSIVSDLGLMSINLHKVENNNIFMNIPCLAFQFICRTWESLTFDMFSEDEEVSLGEAVSQTGLLPASWCIKYLQFNETWIAWWASPKAGDCFTSDEFEQCMWHVTCDIITSWYVTVYHTDMGYVRYIVMLTFVHLQEVVEVRIGSG